METGRLLRRSFLTPRNDGVESGVLVQELLNKGGRMMNNYKGSFLWVMAAIFVVTVVLNLFLAPFAIAQEQKPKWETAQKEKAQKALELETMTVTAQKREENVQDVPASISVFSDIQIEDADIRDTIDLTRLTPNVYVNRAAVQNVIVIRGISTFDASLYSPAGFYVDDVNFPLHHMHNPDLFDIERVEVLKGPQGTLYGRNSESGVINIITKQPDNELRGKIFGEYGSYDTEHGSSPSYRAGGSISGPLVKDKLYLGLAGQWENSDGFMKNI
ncbi:MAG: TonB-dependent receptor, partial [Desulfobacterales bacterium]